MYTEYVTRTIRLKHRTDKVAHIRKEIIKEELGCHNEVTFSVIYNLEPLLAHPVNQSFVW